MCKSFLFRQLLLIATFGVSFIHLGQSQQELFNTRAIDLETSLSEGLYHHILSTIDPYQDLISAQEVDKHKVISLLHTRYPDLTYELERTPKQTIAGKEISALFVQILKEESSAEVLDTDDSFWGIVSDTDLTRDEEAVFKFLYAYELFKQKRFSEADKIFEKIIKERKGEYEHAFYYSGLIALMQKDYQKAEDNLKKIGKNEKLKVQTPYYLAAAHYGEKDYQTVVKYYEPRLNETNLHNKEGLTKIVAYSQYKTGDFNGAIASMRLLENNRALSPEENYVLGIAYQKSGDQESSSKYLSDIASVEGTIASKAQYEHALNLANQGNNKEALAKFEELLTSGDFDKDEIHYNLALLNGRMENLDKLAFHATKLLNGHKKDKALTMITQVLDNIDNETIYKNLIGQLNVSLKDKTVLKSSLYNKAVIALSSNQKDKATEYLDLLADIDPKSEESGPTAAWRGIMAYDDQNYKQAIRLLSNYEASRSADKPLSQLDFDVAYFLGYSNFKLKNHSTALGYFSKAIDLISVQNAPEESVAYLRKEEDLNLRIGDSYFLIDEYKSAERAYTRAINKNGQNKDYALWQTATIAELDNRPYDQILILDEIISDHRSGKYYDRARFNTANALFAIQEYDKAATFYNQVIDSEAPNRLREESTIQLGLISVNAGTYDQAEQYFRKLIDQSKDEEIVYRSNLALKEIYADYTYNTDAYLDLIATDDSDNDEVVNALYQLALENYEKGKIDESIEQWNKLVNDYPNSDLIAESQLMLGKAFEIGTNWESAYNNYMAATAHTDQTKKQLAFTKASNITFEKQKDYKKYLEVVARQSTAFPEAQQSTEDSYRSALASIKTGKHVESIELSRQAIANADLDASKKTELVATLTGDLVQARNWATLITANQQKEISQITNKNSKLIYQRALAYFNTNQLENANNGITDHYDVLLEEPAWLAKGILLVADIFILQDDKDSAAAALEALISSEASIPPTLKESAKEKLKELSPQN